MSSHRFVSLVLFLLFVLIVAIDYWRKASLVKKAATPASPSAAPPPGPSPDA